MMQNRIEGPSDYLHVMLCGCSGMLDAVSTHLCKFGYQSPRSMPSEAEKVLYFDELKHGEIHDCRYAANHFPILVIIFRASISAKKAVAYR
jgi:NAD(P)H-flavin reductase